jgi:phosphate acetyltransferase
MTKANWTQSLWRDKCLEYPGVIGFADGADPRVHRAALNLLREKSIRRAVMFANSEQEASNIKLSLAALGGREGLEAVTIVHGSNSSLMLAAEYLKLDRVDSVLAGNLSTTSDVIRAAIKGVGLFPGIKTVSGSFVMVSPQNNPYLFADCGVVIDPTIEQLIDIAEATVLTWNALGLGESPRVAFLSFSTKGSARHPEVEKIAAAALRFRTKFPDVLSDGELQFDAAFVPEVALLKAPLSLLKGSANCFIFPNLSAGNIAYKLAQRIGKYQALGPILQGVAKPYSDLSRGASVDDIVACSYINQIRSKLGHQQELC